MLVELEIENLALLRRVHVAFAPGFNAISGETGAGKTLVMRALELLRGERADRTQVRDGAIEARVSGLFRVPENLREEIAEAIAPHELEEDDTLLLTRTVGKDGRGRCYANGRLVAQGVLKAVGARLIDLVGQGDAHRLSEPSHRARLVDAFGSLYEDHALYLAARERALSRRERRDRLVADEMLRRQRLDYLRYQLGEIDAVRPLTGELDSLSRESEVLEAAADLRRLAEEGVFELYDSDSAAITVVERLAQRIDALNEGARELLGPAKDALDRAAVELGEATQQLRAATENIGLDPARLDAVNQRLDLLRRLLDRFGPDESTLFQNRVRAESEIATLESDEEDRASADAEFAAAAEELRERGEKLDRSRAEAGSRLARAVERELARLGMPKARFSIDLVRNQGDVVAAAEISGPSRVEFSLSANPGLKPRPIAEVASGGESARIALALQATLSAVLDTPCLVFDEIESGIGARLGDVVADSLAGLAKQRQVLVVTHVAAVAARAERHLHIAKHSSKDATESEIVALVGAARELEIGAMLRGQDAAEAARDTAREMLRRDGKSEKRAKDPKESSA